MGLDVIANVAATCSSAVIAGVALRFSYLQNVGWKPIALVEGDDLGGVPGTSAFYIRFKLDIWNRRKHPIVLKTISITAEGIDPIDSFHTSHRLPKGFMWHSKYGYNSLEHNIDPSKKYSSDVEVLFEHHSLETLRASFEIEIKYFDPVSGKTKSLNVDHRFMEFAFGWNTSDKTESRRQIDEGWISDARVEQRRQPIKGDVG